MTDPSTSLPSVGVCDRVAQRMPALQIALSAAKDAGAELSCLNSVNMTSFFKALSQAKVAIRLAFSSYGKR